MERDEVIKGIRELGSDQPWNHSIELVPGVFTSSPAQSSAGKNLIKWERMRDFLQSFSCKGKRVLDVGSNDGFFSLKLAELGADVVALEASPERVEKAKFVFDTKQVSNSVQLINKDIYQVSIEELGYFDMVLCMGFIHRVTDSYALLSKLSSLSDTLFLEFKAFEEYAYDRPYLMFDGRRSDPNDPYSTCYFIPSARAVVTILKKIGVNYYGIIGNPKARRVMMVASKKNMSSLAELATLGNPNLFYLLKKIIRRFSADVFKALRGDFYKI